jgi:hypothetical protein
MLVEPTRDREEFTTLCTGEKGFGAGQAGDNGNGG